MDIETKLHLAFLAGSMIGIECYAKTLERGCTDNNKTAVSLECINQSASDIITRLNSQISDIPGGDEYLEFLNDQNNGE